MRWVGDVGEARDLHRWRPMTGDLCGDVERLCSVMFDGDAPRDANGLPFQVVYREDQQGRAESLLTDENGDPLAWVLSADGTDDVCDEAGRPALRPVPAEIAEAARAWLAEQQSQG